MVRHGVLQSAAAGRADRAAELGEAQIPFQTVKLQPGVKVVQTPTLLEANVVASNLIRWRGGLPEKLGGWINFFSPPGGAASNISIGGISRALCAWADLNIVNRLAVASTNGLSVLTPTQGGTPANANITPQYEITQTGQSFTTTAGSPIVTINDPGRLG